MILVLLMRAGGLDRHLNIREYTRPPEDIIGEQLSTLNQDIITNNIFLQL